MERDIKMISLNIVKRSVECSGLLAIQTKRLEGVNGSESSRFDMFNAMTHMYLLDDLSMVSLGTFIGIPTGGSIVITLSPREVRERYRSAM